MYAACGLRRVLLRNTRTALRGRALPDPELRPAPPHYMQANPPPRGGGPNFRTDPAAELKPEAEAWVDYSSCGTRGWWQPGPGRPLDCCRCVRAARDSSRPGWAGQGLCPQPGLLVASRRVVALASELAAPDDSAAPCARPPATPRRLSLQPARGAGQSQAEQGGIPARNSNVPGYRSPSLTACGAARRSAVECSNSPHDNSGRGGALEGPSRGVKARGGGGR